MGKINILPKNLSDKIAAGEVVERPASVVKELVENSLDAKSSKIEVIVEDAGRSLIKVVDDGQGMDSDDLKIATLRHATSKIKKDSDLDNINTLGFRGEALSSISAVSFLKIFSKTKTQQTANFIISEAGQIKQMDKVASEKGTVVEVKNLFFNTPARLKFLKSKTTETSYIIRNMHEIALAHPEVALRFISNDEEIISCDSHSDILQRIQILFGSKMADILVPISFKSNVLEIKGFVSLPGYGKNSRKSQYIFVNKRPISDKIISHALSLAYQGSLMQHKFPIAFIFIKTATNLIDVNVHPNKREVRFQEPSVIHDILVKTIKDSLTSKKNFPDISGSFKEDIPQGFNFKNNEYDCSNKEKKLTFDNSFFQETENNIFPFKDDANNYKQNKYLQIDNTYIAVLDKESLVVIDQHAAHERVIFDELKRQFKNKKIEKQKLMFPCTVHFSKDEILLIKDMKKVFDGLGFEIEDFGNDTMAIYSYPSLLGNIDISESFKGIIEDIIDIDNKIDINQDKAINPILASIACHCAVRAHQKLSDQAIGKLINDLFNADSAYTCPHGRPTIISIKKEELEKRFKRK